MNKSFSTLKSNVGAEVQDTSTQFSTIIGRYLNSRYKSVLKMINWKNIRQDYTFTTTNGTQSYVLPDDFGKPMYAFESTNNQPITILDIEQLYKEYASTISDGGNPLRAVILEENVQTQPSSATTISIVSSSSADTTQTVLIRGIVSGVDLTESVSLNGTSTATSTNSFSRVKGISKSANTTGYVTVTASSVTLAVLAPKVLESRYKIMMLHPIPSGSVTITLPYLINPLPMIEDYDYPVIDIEDIIEVGAIADAWRYKRQFQKARDQEAIFNKMVSDYIWDKENQPNQKHQFKPDVYDKDLIY